MRFIQQRGQVGMTAKINLMKIKCNSEQLIFGLNLIEQITEIHRVLFNLGGFGFGFGFGTELARCTTSAFEFVVTNYPFDTFLRFVATVVAGNMDDQGIH